MKTILLTFSLVGWFTVLAANPPSTNCANNLLLNGGFSENFVLGNMPAASVEHWTAAYGTPDVQRRGCEDTVEVQMWGNQVVGEGLQQVLENPLLAGHTYRVSLCYRRGHDPTKLDYIRFRLRASNSPLTKTGGEGALIGITPNTPTASTQWNTASFLWTPDQHYSILTIDPENDEIIDDGALTSIGSIDNVCIEAVQAPPNDLCQDAIEIFCGQTLSGSTVGATDNVDDACDVRFGGEAGPGVWYHFRGTGQTVTASVAGGRVDVFTGSCGGPLACAAPRVSDDMHFLAEAGRDYWIYVSNTSEFELSLECFDCDITGLDVHSISCSSLPPVIFTAPGTYYACFNVYGVGLPPRNEDYKLVIDHIEYPVEVRQYVSPNRVILCGINLPDRGEDIEVFVRVRDNCTWTAPNLYDAPNCDAFDPPQCDLTGISVASGPSCNGDDTYDICFLVQGEDFPQNFNHTKLVTDHIERPIASITPVEGGWEVCAQNIPADGERDIEVFFRAANECTYTARALYDEPDCASARKAAPFQAELQLYPNPATNELHLQTGSIQQPEVRIYNHLNQQVYARALAEEPKHTLDLSHLPAGIYILRLQGVNMSATRKVVIQK